MCVQLLQNRHKLSDNLFYVLFQQRLLTVSIFNMWRVEQEEAGAGDKPKSICKWSQDLLAVTEPDIYKTTVYPSNLNGHCKYTFVKYSVSFHSLFIVEGCTEFST